MLLKSIFLISIAFLPFSQLFADETKIEIAIKPADAALGYFALKTPSPIFEHGRYIFEPDSDILALFMQHPGSDGFLAVCFSQEKDDDGKNTLSVLYNMEGVHQVGTLSLVVLTPGKAGESMKASVFGLTRVRYEHKTPKVISPPLALTASPLKVPVIELEKRSHESAFAGFFNRRIKEVRREVLKLLKKHIEIFRKIYALANKSFTYDGHVLFNTGIEMQKSNDEHFVALAAATLSLYHADNDELQKILETQKIEPALELIKNGFESLCEREIRILGLQEQKALDRAQALTALNQFTEALSAHRESKDEGKKELDDLRLGLQAFVAAEEDAIEVPPPVDNKIPADIYKKIEVELKKLEKTSSLSSEFNSQKVFVERLLALPWNRYSVEQKDLKAAEEIMKSTHFGLKEVKERLLEWLAVQILTEKSSEGLILCLVGPSGVGKTSIAESLAKATGRKFYKFSAGSLDDPRVIKGFPRTYVGANAGVVVDALEKTGTFNPLVLVDEIDKIGKSKQTSDPLGSLIELLMPENRKFHDDFLGIDLDTSRFLFICTANDVSEIHPALYDRLEFIYLDNYAPDEKFKIAKDYIIPRIKRSIHTDQADRQNVSRALDAMQIEDDAIYSIIFDYSAEAGVRNLEKRLKKIFQATAKKLLAGELAATQPIVIKSEDLQSYFGPAIYEKGPMYKTLPIGVATILYAGTLGDSRGYVEMVIRGPASEGLHLTGSVREVMTESVRVAFVVAKNFYARLLGEQNQNQEANRQNFFDVHGVHVHLPQGAIPKEGPSAGVALTSAFLSLALEKPIPSNVAFTGEISLNGKVLRIGGLKEKITGLKTINGKQMIDTVILPVANKTDWEQISPEYREGLTPHFVNDYDEVYHLLFEGRE